MYCNALENILFQSNKNSGVRETAWKLFYDSCRTQVTTLFLPAEKFKLILNCSAEIRYINLSETRRKVVTKYLGVHILILFANSLKCEIIFQNNSYYLRHYTKSRFSCVQCFFPNQLFLDGCNFLISNLDRKRLPHTCIEVKSILI